MEQKEQKANKAEVQEQTAVMLKGQASPEEEAIWKAKYGEVHTAKAEGHIAYFKKPTRQQVSYAMTLAAQGEAFKSSETLLRECFISGSDVFLNDIGYIIGVQPLVERLIAAKQVELGEL
jgi:hypothetical protein